MAAFVRAVYAPFFFFFFVSAAIYLVGQGAGLYWLAPLLVSAIIISRIVEYLLPYEQVWNEPNGDRLRDFIHAVVNETSIISLLLFMPLAAKLVPWPSIWPTNIPLWIQVSLAIILLDIGITLVHFLSHRWNLLWRFHAVHHSVTRMYGFNGLLKHPVHQLIEILGGTLPWLLLGIPTEIAAIGAFCVSTQLLLQHSNVDMKIGWLRYLWAVAPVHRHHHIASSSKGDVNFGLFLTIWDVLLGTANFSSSRNVRSGKIGIENSADYPSDYWGQLLEPLKEKS